MEHLSGKLSFAFQNYANEDFHVRHLPVEDVAELLFAGVLGRNCLEDMEPRRLKEVYRSMLRKSLTCIEYFEPEMVDAYDLVSLVAKTTAAHRKMMRYLDYHYCSVVSLLDVDILVRLLRYRLEHSDSLVREMLAYRNFYTAVLEKLTAIDYDITALGRVDPGVLMRICASKFVPAEIMEPALDTMPEAEIYQVYRLQMVPPDLLIKLFQERRIVPYNVGMTLVRSSPALEEVVREYMRRPTIDFGNFLTAATLTDKHVVRTILDNLCSHVSKDAIRLSLLSSMTLDAIIDRVGIRAFVYVAIDEELFEHRHSINTICRTLSIADIKFMLDHYDVYFGKLNLQRVLMKHSDCEELWRHNPNAILEALDFDEHTESMYLASIVYGKVLFYNYKFITSEMLENMVRFKKFSWATVSHLIEPEELIRFRDFFQLGDVCYPDNARLFECRSLAELYVSKFHRHPMFLFLVTHAPLSAQIRRDMIGMAPEVAGSVLGGLLRKLAYSWEPTQPKPGTVSMDYVTVPDHTQIDRAAQTVALEDGLVLSFKPTIRNTMYVINIGRDNSAALLYHRFEDCALVVADRNPFSGSRGCTIAMRFRRVVRNSHRRDLIIYLVHDLLTLARYGLFYRMLESTKLESLDFDNLTAHPFLEAAAHPLETDLGSYLTLEDALLSYGMPYHCVNHYILRARIYAKHLLQYYFFAIKNFYERGTTHHDLSKFLKSLARLFVDDLSEYHNSLLSETAVELMTFFEGQETPLSSCTRAANLLLVRYMETLVS
ncbi:hypothetical protein KM540_gp054 [Western grey kangaroopox virus]|uniref:Uncharacterized protein n=1 Tax=Western grey kangaroopox virus TaxID=1566307 RepID=A0A2C9DSK2_9POXV|nr:hypothetical protein KM540_gp054 [Western grey kangaroopox virus]ATI20985.1 hypothetical protein [Western grey kangaroopox virus]